MLLAISFLFSPLMRIPYFPFLSPPSHFLCLPLPFFLSPNVLLIARCIVAGVLGTSTPSVLTFFSFVLLNVDWISITLAFLVCTFIRDAS